MTTRFFMVLAIIFSFIFFTYGCPESVHQEGSNTDDSPLSRSLYPPVKFIVIADIHYYDKSLGVKGRAFEDGLKKDRKLLELSQEIFTTVVNEVKIEDADFVIVPGDLTKDGEEICHKGVIKGLKRIADSGKKVFVVPGNHDVANQNSVRYTGNTTEKVKNVSAIEFEKLYKDFGYADAIIRDPGSLSYVAEPLPGLWLMALDSCRWKENEITKKNIAGGAFSKATLRWIHEMLERAEDESKAVIVIMHHGLLEHYPSNEKYYPQYLVEDYKNVSKMLASHNVHMVFTGHFHAQDITGKRYKDSHEFIFDIETGSLVTFPCPYRIVEISKDQKAEIKSRFVSRVRSLETDLFSYAREYVYRGTILKANRALEGYRVSKEDMKIISPQIAESYLAHLAGDEKKPEVIMSDEGVGILGKIVILIQKDLIEGWWTDLPPEDNNLTIDLMNGDPLKK